MVLKALRSMLFRKKCLERPSRNGASFNLDENGSVDSRGFYDSNGMKNKDIHTNDHGNPKWHNYGIHGEHAHNYE